MDCPICSETLNHDSLVFDSYKPCEEDHEESSTVFRLSCGHAYHTTCIIRAIRTSGNHCPVCRGAPHAAPNSAQTNEWGGAEATMTFQNGAIQFQINILDDLIPTAPEATPVNGNPMNYLESMQVLGHVRTHDRRVQKARQALNRVRDDYLEMESFLIRERSATLRDALKDFRKTYKPAYDRMVRDLRRSIKKVRDTEAEAITQSHNAETSQRVMHHMDNTASEYHWTYIARRSIEPMMEPSRKVFWLR